MKNIAIIYALSAFLIAACGGEDGGGQSEIQRQAKRGRAIFLANCVACHNNDPGRDGPIGPAIRGSSRELLTARVLSTNYPPNYRPKRTTKIMPQFPFLKEEIPNLTAYLNN